MSGVVRVPSGSEKELLVAVATVGPLSVSVDASSNAFRVCQCKARVNLYIVIAYTHVFVLQFYSDGVFNSLHCSNTKLTHSMLLTGYGTYEGKQYWLVKNRYMDNSVAWNTYVHECMHSYSCTHHVITHKHTQLGDFMGSRRLHNDVKRPLQPVWNSY